MLIIEDELVAELLPMEDCILAMEEAFMEYAERIAVNRPRVRYACSTPKKEYTYFSNTIVGAVPKSNAAAVRIDSVLIEDDASQIKTGEFWEKKKALHGTPQFQNRNWGLVLLYRLDTAELLAIIQDFTLSGIRVGATTAVGAKHLSRGDATTLGIFGSSKQAGYNLEGLCRVCPISRVKVYSPNPEHRLSFAKEMSSKLGIDVSPVEKPKDAVQEVDIIGCFTSSSEPVFNGEWLVPGQLVITIANSDVVRFKTEVDRTTFMRADTIVVNDMETVHDNRQQELLQPIEEGLFGWDKVHELGDILIGKVPGRKKPEDIAYFKNNSGMGIQFAAASALIYERAIAKRLGHELPSQWFGTDLSKWYKKGYFPSM